MSNFIYNSYCVEHPGVVRIYQTEEERLAAAAAPARRRVEYPRQPLLSYLIAGSAVLAVLLAHWLETTELQGNIPMLTAWMVVWTMAFASVALFSTPARRAIRAVRSAYRAWINSRQQAATDERVWNAALQDARLMADLARAMDRQSR
ncbi:hypothetical protein [Comamonas sp. 26]|uniref:hypothetical protein n=1 Tax=Comamonas sp. 26 TaxID=2035201 RepID=UPI000C175330|nr:hypothetical protein [Comamonas sp. 26]PIF98548.1 hypothetical protein CLU84_4031 [Comamonas sp. 26]